MPSQFERYRMKDGRTSLSEAYFNPIFRDLDLRLSGLEDIESRLDTVISDLQKYGLARIDAAIAPILQAINIDLANKQAEINAYLASLNNAVIPNDLTVQGTLNAKKGSSSIFGLLKTDIDDPTPVVYIKTTIDNKIDAINVRLAALELAITDAQAAMTAIGSRLSAVEVNAVSLAIENRSFFLRGKNLGGTAITINSNVWQAGALNDLTVVYPSSGSTNYTGTNVVATTPTTNAGYKTVFESNNNNAVATAALVIDFLNLEVGTYYPVFWVYQNIAETSKLAFNILSQGVNVGNFDMAPLHTIGRNWAKVRVRSPMTVAGTLTLRIVPIAGSPTMKISGVELYGES